MENLKKSIPSFQQRYEEMRLKTLEHPSVQKFFRDNENIITKEMVEVSLPKLYEFVSQSQTCCWCGDTKKCKNILAGYLPKLFIANGTIDISYVKCEQKIIEEERRNLESRILSMYMPKDILEARIENIAEDNPSRQLIKKSLVGFLDYYKKNNEFSSKGLYIHGTFGVGKSYVLGALAHELAINRIQTVLVYVPEFLIEMKNSISDNSLQQKIEVVKKAQVLMLDDLGAETMSAWIRDEILGTILHYRMSERLPTFITSNFDYKELEEILAKSTKGNVEEVKARRIMERIKALTHAIEMKGVNRRN